MWACGEELFGERGLGEQRIVVARQSDAQVAEVVDGRAPIALGRLGAHLFLLVDAHLVQIGPIVDAERRAARRAHHRVRELVHAVRGWRMVRRRFEGAVRMPVAYGDRATVVEQRARELVQGLELLAQCDRVRVTPQRRVDRDRVVDQCVGSLLLLLLLLLLHGAGGRVGRSHAAQSVDSSGDACRRVGAT